MNFFIITDYFFNVKERITPALFGVNFLYEVNEVKVRDYLNKSADVLKKRNKDFNVESTLKFIKENVSYVLSHDYTKHIIDVPELSYKIICIDSKENETLYFEDEINKEDYLVYFTSNCGYNIVGNDVLVSGAVLSAFIDDGVCEWKVENMPYVKIIDCFDDIEELIELVYFDNDKKYIKVVSEDKFGELFLLKNYVH